MIAESQMKDSGIDWIGEIPLDWQLSRIGKFFSERSDKVDDVSYPPLSVTMNGVLDQLADVAKSNDTSNRKLVKKDDFVINSRSDRKGSSGISPRDGSVSLINIVIEPRNIIPSYISNLFKSYYFKEEFFRNGKGIHWDLWTTRWDYMKNIKMPTPPLEEQKRISEYLDKKTQKIDELVQKTEKKIELLKEQRTALINHCVTKGLNPDAEMKDSGIEWIGEIPKHWNKIRVRYLLEHNGIKIGPFGSALRLDTLVDEGIKIYGQSNVIKNDFSLGHRHLKLEAFEKNFTQYEIIPGDVLITMMGTTGKSKVFKPSYKRGILDSHLLRLRFCSKKILPELFTRILQFGDYIFHQIKLSSKGSIMEGLNSSIVKNLALILPPLEEQKRISDYLGKKTQQIDKLVEKEEKRISLLKEYRQSLISSAVTGKIRITEDML